MGAYELIRRRLPLIIVLDAEGDEDYTFEGLANLTRKARLDFGVEIARHSAGFTCRAWLNGEIDRWLTGGHERMLVLVGEPAWEERDRRMAQPEPR